MRQTSSTARLGHASPSPFTSLIRPRLALLLLVSIASFLAPQIAAAEGPFGFYVGGAVGETTLRSGNVPYLQALLETTPAAFSAHDTGWKALSTHGDCSCHR